MQNLTILNKFIKSLKSRNLFLTALIAGILACALLLPFTANNRAPQAKSFYSPSSTNYVPGEVLLKFRTGTSQVTANNANSKVQAVLMENPGRSEIHHVKLPKDVSVENAIEEYMKDPNVEFAEPNYIRSIHASSSEYAYLWAIQNTGQLVNSFAGTTDADMDVLTFWNNTNNATSSASLIIIAVIDSGVLWSHVDLANNMYANPSDTEDGVDNDANGKTDDIRGWDFVNTDNDPVDDNGHGTHVAGIIGADGSNAKGMTGVMQDVQIMPLKACDSAGACTTANVILAIDYATDRKNRGENVRVINLSLGGADYSASEHTAINQARIAGILVVASAGNDGTNNDTSPKYPASYDLDNIISVAATDQEDLLATSGANGATFSSNYGATSVDVAAPGVNITSTYIASGVSSTYTFLQGTSMAAPQVSGVAGLLWVVNTGWTYTDVRNRILNNVDTKLCLSGLVATNGKVNANQARTATVDLATPTGFTATSASTTGINIAWTDIAGEEGYSVYRKLCSSACSSYSLISAATTTYTSLVDNGLNPGTCYSYHIRAYTTSTAERSDESSEQSATTVADGPGWPSSSGTSQGQDSGHSRNCFIATAAYGSSMHPYVEKLREFRDRHLLTNYLGKNFVETYYKYSPPIADVIKDSEFLKVAARIVLTPVVIFVVYPYTSLAVFIILLMTTVSLINRKQKARI
ncbi:MAG: S8 family serine peptidase [Nitrospirota bacterium]